MKVYAVIREELEAGNGGLIAVTRYKYTATKLADQINSKIDRYKATVEELTLDEVWDG